MIFPASAKVPIVDHCCRLYLYQHKNKCLVYRTSRCTRAESNPLRTLCINRMWKGLVASIVQSVLRTRIPLESVVGDMEKNKEKIIIIKTTCRSWPPFPPASVPGSSALSRSHRTESLCPIQDKKCTEQREEGERKWGGGRGRVDRQTYIYSALFSRVDAFFYNSTLYLFL